jgi:hypothetical protein
VAGRLLEAETDNCTSPYTAITDEWFSYDADGHMIGIWESTPHSGGYYYSIATFTGPMITALNLTNSSWTGTYGLDGEGRLKSLSQNSVSLVSGATYNAASLPTNIAIGSSTSTDNDTYTCAERGCDGVVSWNKEGK